MKRAALILLMLAGCAAAPPVPVVKTVEVRVPVPVLRTPSDELATCGDSLPIPTFVPATDATGAALIGLSSPELAKDLQLIAGLDACNRAWRAWAKP